MKERHGRGVNASKDGSGATLSNEKLLFYGTKMLKTHVKKRNTREKQLQQGKTVKGAKSNKEKKGIQSRKAKSI